MSKQFPGRILSAAKRAALEAKMHRNPNRIVALTEARCQEVLDYLGRPGNPVQATTEWGDYWWAPIVVAHSIYDLGADIAENIPRGAPWGLAEAGEDLEWLFPAEA